MHFSFCPPRAVSIGEAATLARTTPGNIRRYHEAGLLPRPAGGSEDPQYGYTDFLRLLWIEKMAGAGIATEDIRDAFADSARSGADDDGGASGRCLRTPADRLRLLSDFVASRLQDLPRGSLRLADLDSLLLTEHTFGALGAAVQASRFIALATHPDLREESDRVEAAEEGLDDTVAVDDPRVAQVAGQRHAFELAWGPSSRSPAWRRATRRFSNPGRPCTLSPPDASQCDLQDSMTVMEAVGRMPYDFSPARLRSMELAEELAPRGPSAS